MGLRWIYGKHTLFCNLLGGFEMDPSFQLPEQFGRPAVEHISLLLLNLQALGDSLCSKKMQKDVPAEFNLLPQSLCASEIYL